jgi:hypothetical protein
MDAPEEICKAGVFRWYFWGYQGMDGEPTDSRHSSQGGNESSVTGDEYEILYNKAFNMGKSSNKLVDFPLNYVSLREGRLY